MQILQGWRRLFSGNTGLPTLGANSRLLALRTSALGELVKRLDDFRDLPFPPGYALLVDGVWGAGKTHFIKEYIQACREAESEFKPVYVSLYGLRSVDEIDKALVVALYPLLDNKWVGRVGKLAAVGLGALQLNWTLSASDLIAVRGDLFVFDDLERCDMDINAVLGYINALVEHDGSKVVIIANQKEITETEHYMRRREKLIGHTMLLKADLPSVYSTFIQQIRDTECRMLLSAHALDVQAVYKQFGLDNLRLLRQALWDFESFFAWTTEPHRKKKDAMVLVARTLIALSLELRCGRLREAELVEINGWGRYFRKDGEKKKYVEVVQERYAELNFGGNGLPLTQMCDVILRGNASKEIATTLDATPLFSDGGKEPAWLTIWHVFERETSDVQRAIDEVEEKFEQRSILNLGELLHVLGIRLWLAEGGMISKTREQVVEECKAYISALAVAGQLPGKSPSEQESRLGGSAGYGFMERDSDDFRELALFLVTTRQKIFNDQLVNRAQDVLAAVSAPDDSFLCLLTYVPGHQGSGTFAEIPVLSLIASKHFVDALLALPVQRQRPLLYTFKARYSTMQKGSPLFQERQWLEEVKAELGQRAMSASAIDKLRIKALSEYVGEKLVEHWGELLLDEGNSEQISGI